MFERIPCSNYIQKAFTLIEIVIIFAVSALLLAGTLPGLLHARKRSQA
jgi:type II secretory pathway pseudopilin PulG